MDRMTMAPFHRPPWNKETASQMKKQICFAGFGALELEALQPSLAALGGAWDCVFSPDAASALDALAATPFDAAVANLTPGGITDAELLQQAAIRHPRTLRFVLGDVVDRELIVNCMGAAHQFISRPWKPRELVAIIERSLALDAWLSNDKLRAFVPRLGKLPGLPSTYFEVLKRAESPHSSVESISEVIAHDPTLTARLLQMVNSPACGLTKKITSPSEAVSRLGLDTVKSLVLCLQLFAQSAPVAGASISLEQLWHHSFSVAKLASKIVLQCIASEGMASDAYTAGLLHNIGQIVLATNLSKEYSAVVQEAKKRKCPVQQVESEQLGVTSNQVGSYLLGVWGMPLPLVEATALHLAPGSATTIEFSLVTVVHVANVLAYESHGPVNGLVMPELDSDYLATLELPKKTDAWRKVLAAAPSNGNTEIFTAPRVATPAPRRTAAAFPVKKLCVVLGWAAALGAAAVVLKENSALISHAISSSLASGTAAEPAPATKETEGTKTPQVASPFDSMQLQSILYSAGHHVALINGKALEVGDHIGDVKVVSIEPSKVVLVCKGDLKTLSLK
jgi:HD-like signal output (HDOD) protein